MADGLAAHGTYPDQIAAQQTLIVAESYRLSEMRFRAGMDSFLPSLSAIPSFCLSKQSAEFGCV